jgi:hypothetical protein
MKAKAKTAKTNGKTKPAPKAEKAKKPDLIFKSVKPYAGDNMRAKTQKFIPATGVTLDVLIKTSKLKPNKLRRYLRGLVRHGCVKKLAA